MKLNKQYCLVCNKEQSFIYHHGFLGYESFICSVCYSDIKDIRTCPICSFKGLVLRDKIYKCFKCGVEYDKNTIDNNQT